jgi:hypothetical protein
LETSEELREFLTSATEVGIWNALLDRGAAWSIMRVQGVLAEDAPPLGSTIETDLAEHAFSLLRAALAARESGEIAPGLTQQAFERAANAFEALVRNGSDESPERGFFRVLAAASYHLAGFSAIAYSLFSERREGLNTSPAEDALVWLILRDLDSLRDFTRTWLLDSANSDASITEALRGNEIDRETAIVSILNTTVCRALAYFDFALQAGDSVFVEDARRFLTLALKLAADEGAVPHWWLIRVITNLIDDLWSHSLHVNLPQDGPAGSEETYEGLRKLFLISLYGRKSSEVELWPSQRKAAKRSADLSDDLVVALPTSAGKTRIAEIAALMTLSVAKRVLLVTPLRALSAQTERSFRRTFTPLGFSVSSLYGASGVSAGDEDSLRSRNIVIATPEKLDFALRNDPSLIDDVGLIVLDEGHMIGPSEREIRYEILVQRLLKRKDSNDRRIVCLSAILPEGEHLDDLNSWIRGDAEGEPVKSPWRPTRQRFGTIQWRTTAAKLSFSLDEEGPWVSKFVEQMEAKGKQTTPFPRDNKSLTLAAAWAFASQDKRALVFCTQRNHVEGYGKGVIDLVKRGYLPSLLEDPKAINRALEVGTEWLGKDHPAVQCLHLGVAVHHGRLPNPFLREVELLLTQGVLKVTIASPTLAQGININAAVLLVPNLYRAAKLLTGEEFANVAGRAGRAFVDVEGLILHVMFEPDAWRLKTWRGLVASAKARSLQSGLIQVVGEILSRLGQSGVLSRKDAIEYLANSREAWTQEEEATSDPDDEDSEEDVVEEPLSHLVEKLDATVFGLVEALDADASDLPTLLDEALQGSLWARQIGREPEDVQNAHRMILETRAAVIWKNSTADSRRGHFAMGVGLDTGLILDSLAEDLNKLIDRADEAALTGRKQRLSKALIEIADRVLKIRPFVPDFAETPENWQDLLTAWVAGDEIGKIGAENMRFVEEAFTYRLVWALEALRTRRLALGWTPEKVAGGGAAALETGTPQFAMSMLVRAGLPSRQAAIHAIRSTNADFVDGEGMREWLLGSEVTEYTTKQSWPTAETCELWRRFRNETLIREGGRWRVRSTLRAVSDGVEVPDGIYRLEIEAGTDDAWITTPDYRRVAKLRMKLRSASPHFFAVHKAKDERQVRVDHYGPVRPEWYR